MPDLKWVGQHIELAAAVKRPKKLTGTRFAAVLGLNKWSSPFQVWCEVTRTFEKPFVDTIYTRAGKEIEPKQADYMVRSYGMYDLKRPADVFGPDYFKTTRGDFFTKNGIFGGMWDYLVGDPDHPDAVLEMKTTSRIEDWQDDIPEYYALQAALYAYLLQVDQVHMVCSALDGSDYEHPEKFVPSAQNTIVRSFKVSERYPFFYNDYVAPCMTWWSEYVDSAISPDYDEKVDAEYLAGLRQAHVEMKDDNATLIAEAEKLKKTIDAFKLTIADDEKRLKAITDAFKQTCMEQVQDDNMDTAVIAGSHYTWKLTKSTTKKVDEAKLKADGLYDKYSKETTTYTLRCTENGGNE